MSEKNPPENVPTAEADASETVLSSAVPLATNAELEALRVELDTARTETQNARAELEAAHKELADTKDQLLRKAADFDNYRKRTIKEKEELRQFANGDLLADLVQVLDDFERAIKSSEQARDYDALHTGIVMIESQFAQMLERKYHLKRFESVGAPFDPQLHEAISVAGPQSGETVVVEEYQRGYQLHDRVLRTAKVRVGSNPADTPPDTEKETSES